jgi:hypothetical protein
MRKQHQIREIPHDAARILRTLLANMIGHEDRQGVSVLSHLSRGENIDLFPDWPETR